MNTFSAFRSRNYRLFFAGQSISLLGTWMQKSAVSWVVYNQTHSKWMLGVSVFATLFPSSLLTPLGGVFSDRYDRYRILLLTQVLSMFQAIALTLTVWFQTDPVPGILGLSVVLGLINAFDTPARQSLVYEMVEDKKDLSNAVALNSSMVNLSKLLGPAIAGLAIEHLGEVVCFGLNAVSFVAVIASLLQMKLAPYVPQEHTKNILTEFRDGLSYVRENPALGRIIWMLALACLFVLPFTTLMPVYAKDIFHGTASTFGFIDSAVGLGAFAGALYLASLRPGTNLQKVLTVNTFILGAGLLAFSHMTVYPLALLCLIPAAFGTMSQVTISNTLLQTQAAPAMRGRVISLYVMAFSGMLPLGSLLVGAASHYLGVQTTVLVQGILALLLALLHRKELKRKAVPEEAAAVV